MTTPIERPAFIYDDHCPMCRGYTSAFERLGWAERTAFSTIDATTIAALDMDRARHEIPFHDAASGSVTYGLDALIPLLSDRLGPLGPTLRTRPVRRALDGAYWLITYNRRHIVSNAPPAEGTLDCAPDVNAASIGTYVGLCVALAHLTTRRADHAALAAGPVAMAAAGGAALVMARHRDREIADVTAAGHVATVTAATSLAGAAARAVGVGPVGSAMTAMAVGARKIALRRWMLRAG